MKQKDNLYCYKYNNVTNEITEICIENYSVSVNKSTGRKTYSWSNPIINKSYRHESLPESKLDRFVNWKVFTFRHDISYVRTLIYNDICNRYNEAKEQCEKWHKEVKRFKEKYGDL